MKFILATHNRKKCEEMSRILSGIAEVYTADMLGLKLTDVDETGTTFLENAALKARSGCEETGYACIADDSGLCVDYLNGAPGVYSARYSGVHGDDEANIIKLLNNLKEATQDERSAHFTCAVCVSFPDGREISIEEECGGKIAYEKRGNGGFGYDPVFLVGEKSFAELTDEEKDAVSHRGKALRKLAQILPQYIEDNN